MCPLEAMGYFYAQGVTRDMKQGNSFTRRQDFFLKEGSKVEYSGLAATFVGQIYHDLLTCETGKENSMVKTKVSKLKKFWAKCTKKNLNFFQKLFLPIMARNTHKKIKDNRFWVGKILD